MGVSSAAVGATSQRGRAEGDGEKLVLEAAKVEVEKVRKSAEAQISAAVAHFIASKLSGPATAPLLPEISKP